MSGNFLEPYLREALAKLPADDLVDELVRRGWLLKRRRRLVLLAPKAFSDAAGESQDRGGA